MIKEMEIVKKDIHDYRSYHRTKMQKDRIIVKLREQGCRITKQRMMLLDIILEEDCSCCKEIYYQASKKDKNIGVATVYRMINALEEIGAISRKNTYKIECQESCRRNDTLMVEFEDDTVMELPLNKWKHIVQVGLASCGYSKGKAVRAVTAKALE